MSFDQFKLHPSILKALQEAGFEKPTPIQEQAIPLVLEGRDLIGSAQTGTGKTAAFLLPALTRLLNEEPRQDGFQILILEPTRELAIQVQEQCERFGAHTGLRWHCVYGGVSMAPQEEAFKSGVEIIVATPGRLLDCFRQGWVDASRLKVLVLDEADRMLDMGFIPDVRQILKQLPAERQTLFFSATISGEVERLKDDMLVDPVTVAITPDFRTGENIVQGTYMVAEHLKPFLLGMILEQEHVTSALVFTQTKIGADKVCAIVERHNLKVTKIHGDLTQTARQKALQDFKDGEVNVLVATDVAARGIDVDGVTHVINFNPPESSDDYIHRIGRTARAGKEGHAYTLFAPAEAIKMALIEKEIKQKVPRKIMEGFDYTEELGPQHEIRQGHNVGEFRKPRRSDSGDADRGGRPKRGGRPEKGKPARGRKDNGRSDNSGSGATEFAEVVIKRKGGRPAPEHRPKEESRPAPQNPQESSEKNSQGRRQGSSPGAEMTATDILRKAAEQIPAVDDSGLSLRPPNTETKAPEKPATLPQEKLSASRSSSQGQDDRPRPPRNDRNRNRGRNSSRGESPAAAETKHQAETRPSSETDGRPPRKRRRGGRGRRGRQREGSPAGNGASTASAAAPKKSGFMAKIKGFFTGN